ncbi:arginyltransferase [Alteromonas sp. IB21]|nr:arginyltransferase [Alteromonas sp. IB21]MBJ2130360.1 arginyltransferase [Alteromonas sp. IB21]
METKSDYTVKFGITQSFSCSYLPDEQEQLLVYAEDSELHSLRYSQLIQAGFRRSGEQIYRPHCPNCNACKSIRIPVDNFTASRSQKRILKVNGGFKVQFSDNIKETYFPLYERYINERHSDGSMYPASQTQFDNFVQSDWMKTHYLEAYDGDKLIAVAVTDIVDANVPMSSLSALYTFFDPDYASASLGTWMILMQIMQAKQLGYRYLYLGYYVEGCNKMSYKQKFLPFEQFSDNQWHLFSKNSKIPT